MKVIATEPLDQRIDIEDPPSDPRGRFSAVCVKQFDHLKTYVSSDACVPFLALAILHMSALSYSATFITFLLNSGFSLLLITIARTIGSCFEILSTFIAPFSINHLAHAKENLSPTEESEMLLEREDQGGVLAKQVAKQHEIGLARAGLWGIMFQIASLVCDILGKRTALYILTV